MPTVAINVNLDDALDAMRGGHGWLTVLDADRKVRGIRATRDIARGYRVEAERDAKRFQHAGFNVDVAGSAGTAGDLQRAADRRQLEARANPAANSFQVPSSVMEAFFASGP